MPYRVEESKNARAGCKNKECKDAGVKIQKGELRFATQVTIQEHTSWAYKHWGCVTPAQVANLIEESGGDTEMVDGYDELPADLKEKVDFALQNGHVPDEDWKGDVECNRPGQKGFRAKAPPKKKGKEGDEDDEEAVEAAKPKAKRGRANKETAEDDAPAPKKARGKSKKAAVKEENDEGDAAEEVEAPKSKRGKKAAAKEEVEENDVEEPELPKAKRGRKAVPKQEIDEDEAGEPKAPKAKRGKKADADSKAAPQKRSSRKKAVVNYEEE